MKKVENSQNAPEELIDTSSNQKENSSKGTITKKKSVKFAKVGDDGDNW